MSQFCFCTAVCDLEVGLCVASVLHRDPQVSLKIRCEWAISGFLVIDVMKVLSDETCRRMALPKGSCYMASQTCTNLQSSALAIALMRFSKDPTFLPWRNGSCRLSELPVEQHFSMCRAQSVNSQLSARAFWKASARVALKNGKILNKAKPVDLREESLTEEESLGVEICSGLHFVVTVEFVYHVAILYSHRRDGQHR